ncbi:MAG: 2-C-methyl-D-erythritol 4-phosphate cytidylyltransferase [Ruminococcus sp.]|nr:2-C-methyl-D-erythritol 4-phosphate cytidylyltransferase [Ruminococcus sp.]
MVVALLTAAGIGSRMGQDIPKQFIHVNNKPLIVYTLEAFERHPSIDEIVIVTLPNWMDVVKAYASQFNITKLKAIVPGGDTGQESIHNGLMAIKDAHESENPIVMIHDGNRCLVSSEIISNSLAVYKKHGSAVAAIPCVEAVFYSRDGGLSSTTSIPREQLYRTQTPHTYALDKLLWAHEQAAEKGIENTAASCTLMQALGETVYFSKGAEKNMKITTTEDLDLFEVLLHTERTTWLK